MKTKEQSINIQEAQSLLAQEKQKREIACATEYNELLAGLLEKHKCTFEILFITSSLGNNAFQVKFNAR